MIVHPTNRWFIDVTKKYFKGQYLAYRIHIVYEFIGHKKKLGDIWLLGVVMEIKVYNRLYKNVWRSVDWWRYKTGNKPTQPYERVQIKTWNSFFLPI